MKPLNYFYRFYRIVGRVIIKHSKDSRPSSAPYISGDGFRKMADHLHDATGNCNPDAVNENDVIFIGDARSKQFLTEINPSIKVNYTLISHNSDELIDGSYLPLLTPNIKRWYSYNVDVQDERIIPIPLGLENKHYFVTGNTSVFNWVKRLKIEKSSVIFYGYSMSTNLKARKKAHAVVSEHPLAQPLSAWREFGPYLKEVAGCKFVQSPRGSSIEGCRTWEAMYIGSVPIVISNVTNDYFSTLGAPMLVLKNWNEMTLLNKENIDYVYADILQKANMEMLHMEYWINKINKSGR